MIILSFGSNLGNRLNYLRSAAQLVRERWIPDLRTSIVIETEALLLPDAAPEWNLPFLNTLAYGTYEGDPSVLLRGLKEIECMLGRQPPYEKWSPRKIDIDILLFNDCKISTAELEIPHAQLMERPFLIQLLALTLPNQAMNGCTWAEHAASYSVPSWHQSMILDPQLVGIVNVTPDSFSDGGDFYQTDKAVERIWQLAADGASVVDVGAQSTRPGASILSHDEEWARLEPVLDSLQKDMESGHIRISLDSFQSDIIHRAIRYPIEWVNDVTGRLDDNILKRVADRGCKLIAMHALSVPPEPGKFIQGDPVDVVNAWVKEQLPRWKRCGLNETNVVIDPGIGFGKSVYQNIELLRRAEEFKKHGLGVFIGHSRKSWIGSLNNHAARERDMESIAASCVLAPHVDYLRVHNIHDHMRAMSVSALLK